MMTTGMAKGSAVVVPVIDDTSAIIELIKQEPAPMADNDDGTWHKYQVHVLESLRGLHQSTTALAQEVSALRDGMRDLPYASKSDCDAKATTAAAHRDRLTAKVAEHDVLLGVVGGKSQLAERVAALETKTNSLLVSRAVLAGYLLAAVAGGAAIAKYLLP